jgi:hypothetical protein
MLRFFYNVILKTIDTKGTESKKSIPVENSGGWVDAINRITISFARSYLSESDAFFGL